MQQFNHSTNVKKSEITAGSIAGAIFLWCSCWLQAEAGVKAMEASPQLDSTAANSWRAAKTRGVKFRAVGHQPEWVMELTHDSQILITFSESENVKQYRYEPLKAYYDNRKMVLNIDGEGHISMTSKSCRNSHSGEYFQKAVTINIGEISLNGCGLALSPNMGLVPATAGLSK